MVNVFISYARDDDLPPPGEPDLKGFVTFFDDALRFKFKDLGPDRPQIWRDIKRISDGDQFSPEIDDALQEASLLIVVLSPNWMASRWCRKELDTFAKYHGADGRVRERVVVVGKRHVDPDKRPSLLQGQTGFKFYVRNDDPEEVTEGSEFFERGRIRDDRYWTVLNALAAHVVKRQLHDIPWTTTYPPTGRTIFVAKPASDMRTNYDRVVSELVRKGHTVVPNPKVEISLNTAAEEIDAALLDAEISVHLLGEKSGEAPEDQLPLVKLQLARAEKRAAADATSRFHRLVWAPSLWSVALDANLIPREMTRRPLEILEKFGRQLPADKVEGDSLSKFIDFLHQHISNNVPPMPVLPPSAERGERRLYLHHALEDSTYALALAQALQQRNLEALVPAFEGTESEIKNFNSKQMVDCDGVILCWAAASEVWVRAQASGLRDWLALGRSQQFFYRAVVAAPPPGERKKASKLLFPRSEIDLVVDLTDNDIPTADLLDILVPAPRSSAP